MGDELPGLQGELEAGRCGITPPLRGLDLRKLVKGLLDLDYSEKPEIVCLRPCKPTAADLDRIISFLFQSVVSLSGGSCRLNPGYPVFH